MKRISALSFAALALSMSLSAMPAHAQILGGRGGIGGGLGGTLGGGVGTMGPAGSMGSPIDSVRGTASGTARGTASTTGSQSINRKTGTVQVQRSGTTSAAANLADSTHTPLTSTTNGVNGAGTVSGGTSANAQLIGTNAVKSAAQSAGSAVTSTANQAGSKAKSTGKAVGKRASSAVDDTSAQASGSADANVR